ncbi:MAG: TetR/AcrR family transcriptional regulator [Arenicella sp.]
MPRPLEHNREDVINAAMQVFWDKGYSATSMTDLKAATGLNPGSLYSSYQSKESLFLATLEFYCEKSIENLKNTLMHDTQYIRNIYQFFENFEENYMPDGDVSKGCFFVNTLIEMSPHNPKVKDLLATYTERYQNTFVLALEKAKELKEINAKEDVALIAQQLMLTIWGLRVMHRSGLLRNTKTIVIQQLNDIFKAI